MSKEFFGSKKIIGLLERNFEKENQGYVGSKKIGPAKVYFKGRE
ncbi:MAG: hypothetical protein QXZ17_04840 [Nitrososphaerota archaeon]